MWYLRPHEREETLVGGRMISLHGGYIYYIFLKVS